MHGWGANSHGQLGLGFTSEMCDSPQQVESIPVELKNIASVSAGGGHTLILADDGQLFASGWNNRGQLGLGHAEDVNRFTCVTVGREEGFKSIATGWDVSGAINARGDLYLWGSNVWLQIADKSVKYLSTPTRVELPAGRYAQKVCFGLRHTCVLMDDGSLLLFGKSKWLEQGKYDGFVRCGMPFFHLKDDEKITDVVSGENHLVLQYQQEAIVCKGDDKFGQCLKGRDVNISRNEIVKLQSGWSHSGYLTRHGTVYLWGRNSYGQLGVPAGTAGCDDPVLLNIESKVIDFCLGSQHGIALAEDGLYTWGWNEHGNCGVGGLENVWAPTKITDMKKCDKISTGVAFCFAWQTGRRFSF
ncbi:secretion-regulating guanine nucleotide exchange factor isoform X2 [Sabethes cyaneus]|uniref:secretion-regulating guanine nucleotide exchange factor isoform X2 n=1 Tax=Sabethes cyaneus TaxID=53552 RepID=UPI00237D68AE|nr:secretion-regulating guanine nucleotide exchange factor isoform X2 [Sabethes cyaneus]XP_053692055.1 secretion-regulating guanine nucleotide exchange factor isoform X2 [Sabethes cyaneus]XP_053692056.1 secretion-regulating guanine nucleotide exchange factor isoform X2 [Sabethes cyaneus]